MLKSSVLLNTIQNLKPGEHITWPVYDGDDIQDAKILENYVTTFFKTGDIMPIPVFNLGLNIHSIQTEYDDGHHTYKVIIEGLVVKPKV